MSRLCSKIGYWSSLVALALFIIYMVSFVAILVINPLFTWKDMPDYIAHVQTHNQFFKYLAQGAMLLFSVFFLIILTSILEVVQGERKLLARVANHFGIAFVVTTAVHYFVQISAVRLNILAGETEGLLQFVQEYPISGMAAINMLGWTLFLGLSSLFVALVFSGKGVRNLIRYALLSNAVICLLGGAAYVLDITLLVFLTMNLAMGLAFFLALIGLVVHFRRGGAATSTESPV